MKFIHIYYIYSYISWTFPAHPLISPVILHLKARLCCRLFFLSHRVVVGETPQNNPKVVSKPGAHMAAQSGNMYQADCKPRLTHDTKQ